MVIVIAICQCSVTSAWKQGNIGNHHVLGYINMKDRKLKVTKLNYEEEYSIYDFLNEYETISFGGITYIII